MLLQAIEVFHIAVLGYWLGSELVINSGFRYVCRSVDMAFPERNRLFDHVLVVDQHVRYALILQLSLGTILAALLGYIPGGAPVAWSAAALGVAWLALVEVTHRARHSAAGRGLAAADRGLRYMVLAVLIAVGVGALVGFVPLDLWLAVKLICFAGVILCGVVIRLYIISFFQTWSKLADGEPAVAHQPRIWQIYVRSTSALGVLWALIAVITTISILKPG